MKYYMLAIFGVMLSSVAQIFLKMAANTSINNSNILHAWLGLRAISGFILLFVAVLISAHVVRFLEIGEIVSITALSYPFVILMSLVFLGESFTRHQYAGLGMLCAGVLVFNL